MSQLVHRIADLCIDAEKAPSLAPLRRVLQSAAEAFGALFYLFAMRSGRDLSPPRQIVMSTYPKEWQRRYDASGAMAFDPVLAKALQGPGVFRWEGLHRDERQLALRRESVRHGMEFGFSCSDRGQHGSMAILSFCADKPILPAPEQWDRGSIAASLLATSVHRAALRTLTAGSETEAAKELSQAERRCLELLASGHTAQSAAPLLGVKARTVRYYLDRAAEKLEAKSGKEALLKAVSSGIIDARRFPDAAFRTSLKVE